MNWHGASIAWHGEEWLCMAYHPAHGTNEALFEWHSRDTMTRTYTPAGTIPVTARLLREGDGSGVVGVRGARDIVA